MSYQPFQKHTQLYKSKNKQKKYWNVYALYISKCFFFCHLTLTSSPLLSLISGLKLLGLRKSYKDVIIRVA